MELDVSGSYQSPNNESSSRSLLLSTQGISVTGVLIGEQKGEEANQE